MTFTTAVAPAGPAVHTGTVAFTSNGTTITGCSAVTVTSSRKAAAPPHRYLSLVVISSVPHLLSRISILLFASRVHC
ncbi:MAG: hypothetical protein WCA20_06860 [Candidatus Sulfotelmatobacter sp.]